MRLVIADATSSFILLPSLFIPTAMSALLGCGAVECPLVENTRGSAQCEIGNATLQAIGIANVTSSTNTTFDTEPFTWTLGIQDSKKPGNDSQFVLDRNFYLGTPPSLQLKDKIGCGLFFEGIATKFSRPNGPKTDNLTCPDIIAESCIADLISQASSAVEDIWDGPQNDGDFCSKLGETLVEMPPSSCSSAIDSQSKSWGTVIARPLTGDTAPPNSNQTQCHPTTGHDYDLKLILSYRYQPSSRNFSDLAPIANAITPVMTVMTDGNATALQLTCLKLVETSEGQVTGGSDPEGSASIHAPFISSLALFAMVLAFII